MLELDRKPTMVFGRRILLLSPYPERLLPFFGSDRVTCAETITYGFDWVVSYGYRKIICEPALSFYKDRIVNLHISFLPWNRGAHPNVWSWIDGTPKGVTIHYIDAGVDTGDIIVQREVAMSDETLASSYSKLTNSIERLFAEAWPMIRNGTAPRQPQLGGGSYHATCEVVDLPNGWDTPVALLVEH